MEALLIIIATYLYLFCIVDMQALNCFAMIVKNKQYSQASRLRVNMGNVYFDQKKFRPAARMYRMALDQIPDTNKETRKKVFTVSRTRSHALVPQILTLNSRPNLAPTSPPHT